MERAINICKILMQLNGQDAKRLGLIVEREIMVNIMQTWDNGQGAQAFRLDCA